MKKLLFILHIAIVGNIKAQQAPIALVSANGTTRLTTTLDSAALLAQDNDIIYLPGGGICRTNTVVYKKGYCYWSGA